MTKNKTGVPCSNTNNKNKFTLDLQTQIEAFVAAVKAGSRPLTAHKYAVELKRFTKWTAARQISHVEQLNAGLFAGFWRERIVGLQSNSTLAAFSAHRRLGAWCAEIHGVKDWTRGTIMPRRFSNPIHILTAKELAVLTTKPNPMTPMNARDWALVILLHESGARLSEVLSMTTAVEPASRETLVTLKGGSVDKVMFGETGEAALVAWLALRPQVVTEASREHLFVSPRGNPLTTALACRVLEIYARNRGLLRRFHAHLLRHTYATNLIEQGASLPVVQSLLHHTSYLSTARYVHPTADSLKAALQKFHPSFGGTKTETKNQKEK